MLSLPACGDGAADDDTADDDDGETEFAAGGTAAMIGFYPDPFTDGVAPACLLTCAQILGPCYADVNLDRRDVSDGKDGLPMRLALKVVYADTCEPVTGAGIEIWHVSTDGVYSGPTGSEFCRNGDDTAAAEVFFRGTQTSDAAGRVDFDSCFPGWYPGRTPHIHFTVTIGGEAYVTSQLYFDDALTERIYRNHPDYAHRPVRDTTNATDMIGGVAAATPFLVETAVMDDGALQAWLLIGIRRDPDGDLCFAR